MAKPLPAEYVGARLAPQPPPHHLAICPCRRSGHARLRLRGKPNPVPTGGLGQEQLGVQPRRFDPYRSQRIDGAAERVANAPRGRRPGHAQAAEAAASSRCRFSSAPTAWVNSESSPASTPSRLCEVSLIRWSVTRPWGKL